MAISTIYCDFQKIQRLQTCLLTRASFQLDHWECKHVTDFQNIRFDFTPEIRQKLNQSKA